jgi:hypothetical protein
MEPAVSNAHRTQLRGGSRRRWRSASLTAALALGVLTVVLTTIPSGAAQQCGTSAGVSICLIVPPGPLTGDVTISATVNGSGSGISEVIFSWGSTPANFDRLLSDFEAPYSFVWRTDRYLDATRYVNVRVERNGSTVGAPISLQATLENGNDASVPQNPADWDQLFAPRPATGDPVIAAAGDGGDGTAGSNAVAASIDASDASVLLYLGDLYERGTAAEFDFNYGRSSFEAGGGRQWGALAGWTKPTLGNHEGFNIPTWRDYWHGRPNWETFVYGGVRFLNLNSECGRIGGCGTSSAQYRFVANTLASNTQSCVVGFWHRPVLSVWEDTPTMEPIWRLLADNGGDLVLNGHDHTALRTVPLNRSLQAGQPNSHMIQVTAGTGGHQETSVSDGDPRYAWHLTGASGAAYVRLVGGATGAATRLVGEFRDESGALLPGSTFDVSCSGTADVTPPTIPGTPTGSSSSPGSIDLTWAASTDDQATSIVYRVYRDGGATPVGTVTSASTTTVSFADTGLAAESTHTYAVDAGDGVNWSAASTPSSPITVMQAPGPVFLDGFDSGLSLWSGAMGLTVDASSFPPTGTAPSVRAQVMNQRASASHDLGASYPALCMSEAVNLSSISGSAVALLKLRTSTNQSVGRVFVNPARFLFVRADITGTTLSSGVALPAGWNTVRLCGVTGASGSWTLWLNGTQIGSWSANNGTSPISRIQIGDEAAKTVTFNLDNVVVTDGAA